MDAELNQLQVKEAEERIREEKKQSAKAAAVPVPSIAEAKAIEDARLAEIERALKEAARLQAIEDERLATLARLNASVVIQSYFRRYRTHNRYQL